jgi:hypothetical protein
MEGQSHKSKPLLFISHKHVDKRIADVITRFIRMGSGGRVEVYQSSNAWAEGPQVGRNLNRELKEALWKTSVFIMVYTSPDQDWNYCMWECGVASHPQSPDTRIILFQCAGVAPTLFAEQVNVDVRKLSNLQKFTNEFLTDPDFFPRFPGPITQFQRNGQEVAAAAAELYQDLEPIIPQPGDSEEWPAWPFLQLELGLEHVEPISKAEDNKTIDVAKRIVQKECLVTQGDDICERLFGAPSFQRGMTFETLTEMWKEERPGSKSKWIDALCEQIIDGSQWRFPPIVWELMQGVNDSTWYAPVLNRVRRIPSQQCLQFDIYFYKFDVDTSNGSVNVGVPDLG